MLAALDKDALVFWAFMVAAELGRPAPTSDQLCEMLDMGDGGPGISTTVLITQRLEKRGLIHVVRYQREREIMITATGKWTAPARCKTPHWRAAKAA